MQAEIQLKMNFQVTQSVIVATGRNLRKKEHYMGFMALWLTMRAPSTAAGTGYTTSRQETAQLLKFTSWHLS